MTPGFLFGRPRAPYDVAMNAVILPPDLEQFADDAVASGRFSDVAEVVRAGLTLLQRAETQRAAFEASLDRAIVEGERDGFLSIEEVERDLDEVIDKVVRARA